ncbi:MAG: CheR family methyltransferase [Gemmataceae bacterium]|nr:hypothetical protein [Gemmata sp.]MDW8198632.1 CheR family methyltransferase [Gemmataceae bacterium]
MKQPADADDAAGFGGPPLCDAEFHAIRDLLYEWTGISLSPAKRNMVCARLAKRLRHHGLHSFREYYQLLQDDSLGLQERQQFINCLTTNKTDFFREPHHFDFLRDPIIATLQTRQVRRLRIWSCACSTGEEPYTLAMILAEHCPRSQGWDTEILASDIDTDVLAKAQQGIYPAERIAPVPEAWRRKYFLRGYGAKQGQVAVKPELRHRVKFRQINLTDDHWPIRTTFDVIFCRNVLIYFDRPTQSRILERFTHYLTPGGYLFLGHSENIHWLAERYRPLGGTVYQWRCPHDTPAPSVTVPARPIPPSLPEYSLILGDVKTASQPAILKTLLGSCVSACLYDPEAGIGGMNHFSLPGSSDEGTNTRYGVHAMEMLITAIMKQGGERHRLRAKVFGGAKVLPVTSERLNIGARNSAFVQKFLATEGIPIEAQCLGGTRGLIVRFRPDTGQAWAKPLAPSDLTDLLRKEEEFGRQLQTQVAAPADDRITLF